MGLLDRLFGKPSIVDFAHQMIQAFREAGDNSELRFDPSENRIVRGDPDPPSTINLANMYQTFLREPRSRRAECVRSLARGILTSTKELLKDFDLVGADLRPRLWPGASFEQVCLKNILGGGPVQPKPLLSESIGEHLLLSLAYDRPQAVQSLDDDNLTDWGVTFYEAMEVARQNLQESTVAYGKIGDGFYSFISGDTYDASRITLVQRTEGLEVNGKVVAMVPNRDSLFVTGSEDEAGFAIMAAMAEKALEQPYSLSAVPLSFEDGAWQDWLPPEGHPLHRTFEKIRINWIGPLYHEQVQLLNAIHEKQGIDIFVANYSAIGKKGGELLTYCIWGKGGDALLPVNPAGCLHEG
jgi:hypothetical protein